MILEEEDIIGDTIGMNQGCQEMFSRDMRSMSRKRTDANARGRSVTKDG